MQRVRVVWYGFKAFKLPKLIIGIAVEKLSGGYLPFPMLINQLHRIGGQLLFLDALIVFSVVQFVQIALDFPALRSRQLDCIPNFLSCFPSCLMSKQTRRLFSSTLVRWLNTLRLPETYSSNAAAIRAASGSGCFKSSS